MAPLDLVKDGPVLVHEGCVIEQALGEGGLYSPHCFLVGGAEVGAEHEAYLEEQVLCKDVRECTCNISMMFDLAEA